MNLGRKILHIVNISKNAETIADIANQTLKGYNRIEVIQYGSDSYFLVGNNIAEKHLKQLIDEAKQHHESLKHK